MVERSEGKVNAFAPPGGAREAMETSLQSRVQSLTCLLRLGRLIESEDHVPYVTERVPDILVEGLWRNEPIGVRLTLGGYVHLSADFQSGRCVSRRMILVRHSPVGDLEVHTPGEATLSPEQEALIAAMAERLGRFYERKSLQSALERSEHRYRRLFQQARDGIVLVDAETGIVLDANECFLDFVRLTLDDVRALKIWELVAPSRREAFRLEFKRRAANPDNESFSLPVETHDGELELEVTAALLQFNEYRVLQLISRDVTERRRLTSRLAESEMRYRAIFESTPVSMVLCDGRGGVLDVNACLMTKFFHDQVDKSSFAGRPVLDLGLVDLGARRDEFLRFLDGLCVHLEEVAIPASPYRTAGVANVRGIPLVNDRNEVEGGVVFIEDVTEYRETQRAMLQSAKIAAVGQMTLGFAHEIGTPLGIIMANAQFLLQECEGGKGAEELAVILSETNRITNLIQHLLIFSRPAKFRPQTVSVNELVKEVLALMQGQEVMRDIEVVTGFSSDAPPIRLEPTLIKQVFFNLVLNACQAMPNGGCLTVKTRLVRSQPVGESRAPHIEIAFRDTGVGISRANLRRIFTPFFTTKETGQGTGLGLSVSYRIVQNHGGTIVAESPGEGQGALFRVYLPLSGPPDYQSLTPLSGGETDE